MAADVELVLGIVADLTGSEQEKNKILAIAKNGSAQIANIENARASQALAIQARELENFKASRRAITSDLEAASRRVSSAAGNPFMVLANVSGTITGIKRIKDEVQNSQAALTQAAQSYQADQNAATELAVRSAERRARAAIAETKGLKFTGRAIADFFTQNLITGALFSAVFPAAQAITEVLVAGATTFGRDLLEPMWRAREAATQLVATLKSAGGPARFGALFGLNDNEVAALRRLAIAGSAQSLTEQRIQYERYAGFGGGGSASAAMIREASKSLSEERLKQSKAVQEQGSILLDIFGVAAIAAAGVATIATGGLAAPILITAGLGAGAIAAGTNAGISGTVGSVITEQERKDAANRKALYDTSNDVLRNSLFNLNDILQKGTPKAEDIQGILDTFGVINDVGVSVKMLGDSTNRATQAFNQMAPALLKIATEKQFGERYNKAVSLMRTGVDLALLTGNRADIYKGFAGANAQLLSTNIVGPGGGPMAGRPVSDFGNQLYNAQKRVNDLQLSAAQSQIAAQWGAIRDQQAQIRASVAKSFIGRVGMTGFELAAQIAEARAQARVQQHQLDAQKNQLAQQQRIAAASKKVAELNDWDKVNQFTTQLQNATRDADAAAYGKAINTALKGGEGAKSLPEQIGAWTAYYIGLASTSGTAPSKPVF
jgi:hypothetical protein